VCARRRSRSNCGGRGSPSSTSNRLLSVLNLNRGFTQSYTRRPRRLGRVAARALKSGSSGNSVLPTHVGEGAGTVRADGHGAIHPQESQPRIARALAEALTVAGKAMFVLEHDSLPLMWTALHAPCRRLGQRSVLKMDTYRVRALVARNTRPFRGARHFGALRFRITSSGLSGGHAFLHCPGAARPNSRRKPVARTAASN